MQCGDDRLAVIANDIGRVVVALATYGHHIENHFLRLVAGGAPDQREAFQRVHYVGLTFIPLAWRGRLRFRVAAASRAMSARRYAVLTPGSFALAARCSHSNALALCSRARDDIGRPEGSSVAPRCQTVVANFGSATLPTGP